MYNIINEYTICHWLIVRQKETAKCIHIKYGKMFLQIFTTCSNDFKHLILHWIPGFFSLSLTTLPYNWCYMKMYPVGRFITWNCSINCWILCFCLLLFIKHVKNSLLTSEKIASLVFDGWVDRWN